MANSILTEPRGLAPRTPFYYGWVNLGIAALAMVATLPGRTHGLGLITEPLLTDLQLPRTTYTTFNFWATILGAAFCLPAGRLLDRFGPRRTLTGVALLLGVVVWVMSAVTSAPALFVTMTLTRGLGQGALSVVSVALVGKWFVRRLHKAMALYTVLLGIGFMAAFKIVGDSATDDWRGAWAAIGLALLAVLAPIGWLFVRDSAEAVGLIGDNDPATVPSPADSLHSGGVTLRQALATSTFWAFALASSLFLMVSSATSLLGESILRERGFVREHFITASVMTAFTALACNLLGGWLAERWAPGKLLGVSMGLLTAVLLALPQLREEWHVYVYALASGAVAGFVTVLFFAIWSHAFGRAHLGRIQGAAQMLTVLGSALGPWLLEHGYAVSGSYAPVFYVLAPLAAVLGAWAWSVTVPDARPIRDPQLQALGSETAK